MILFLFFGIVLNCMNRMNIILVDVKTGLLFLWWRFSHRSVISWSSDSLLRTFFFYYLNYFMEIFLKKIYITSMYLCNLSFKASSKDLNLNYFLLVNEIHLTFPLLAHNQNNWCVIITLLCLVCQSRGPRWIYIILHVVLDEITLFHVSCEVFLDTLCIFL